jgi:hypothetical protein
MDEIGSGLAIRSRDHHVGFCHSGHWFTGDTPGESPRNGRAACEKTEISPGDLLFIEPLVFEFGKVVTHRALLQILKVCKRV